jgi:hypothetical protein
MAATLQTLVGAPEHRAFAMLEDLRKTSDHFSPNQQYSTSASPSSDQRPLGRHSQSEATLPDCSLSSIAQVFTPVALPPESDVREGAARFFANTSALFYVMTFDELEALLDKIYRSSASVDVLSLCEICSLASVGSQYLPEQPSQSLKQSLYLTATAHIRQCLEVDKVRTIRILACLACYNIVEHREAARLSIGKHIVLCLFRWLLTPDQLLACISHARS